MSSDQGGEFPVSYDAVTKSISAVTCGLAVAVGVVIHNPIAATILILVFVLSYAYSPRGYSVSSKSIIVKRLIGDVRIPLDHLRAARRISADDLRGCIRLWGSGGLFGYYGLFRTSKLGRCTWYATNRKNLFVTIGAKKTTVLSPDDVDGFLRAIQAEAPVLADLPELQAGEAGFAGATKPAVGTALWIGLVVVIFAALGMLAGILLLVSHGRSGIR